MSAKSEIKAFFLFYFVVEQPLFRNVIWCYAKKRPKHQSVAAAQVCYTEYSRIWMVIMLICCIFTRFEAFPSRCEGWRHSGVLPPAFPSTSHSPETRLLSSAKLIAGESTSCCGCLSLSGTSAVWWGSDLTRTLSASHSNVSWDGLQPLVLLHSQPEWIMDEMDLSLLKQLTEFSFFLFFDQEYTIQASSFLAILIFSAHSGTRLAINSLVSSSTANTFKANKVWVAGTCEPPCLNTITVKYLSCSDSVSAGNSTKSIKIAETYGQWAAKSTEGILVLKVEVGYTTREQTGLARASPRYASGWEGSIFSGSDRSQ